MERLGSGSCLRSRGLRFGFGCGSCAVYQGGAGQQKGLDVSSVGRDGRCKGMSSRNYML
jgi:hypothetical protein